MKIACLQFSPQVGDVDDNLNRADAVLGRVDPEELDSLDLLVLPELALTGYNFRSLQDIAPFLEEAGSGISSLWARTTALKHDCTVVVGYPEKVDVSEKQQTSSEYYNSAVIINGEGDTVGNYRKSFLYYTDETWAQEGTDGFFQAEIPKLGNVALGICTDLNPYKLEAPWDAFEFGFHIIKSQANLVIMSMAWQTHHDPNVFGLNPAEPDLETLVYWVQRLEPLICADTEEEVIVVFCNRAGSEEEVTYTGTSAVIGIKRGEVLVYGVLGRGVNDLLIVDTDQLPTSKLTDADAVAGDKEAVAEKEKAPDAGIRGGLPPAQIPGDRPSEENEETPRNPAGQGFPSPRQPTSPRFPWLAQPTQPGEAPTDSRAPTRLQIPTSLPAEEVYTAIDTAFTDDDITIDTPAMAPTPSFARRLPRPALAIPASPGWRFAGGRSPYPWQHHDGSHSSVFGGGAALTPITPFDEDGWSSTPIDPKGPPQWFWRHEPTLAALRESTVEEDEKGREGKEKENEIEDGAEGRKEAEKEKEEDERVVVVVEEEEKVEGEKVEKENTSDLQQHTTLPSAREGKQDEIDARADESFDYNTKSQHAESKERVTDWTTQKRREDAGEREEAGLAEEHTAVDNEWADLAQVLDELRSRPRSSRGVSSSSHVDRPISPKSRNLSRPSSPFRSLEHRARRNYGELEQDRVPDCGGWIVDDKAARSHQEHPQWQLRRQTSRLCHVVSRDDAGDGTGSLNTDNTTPLVAANPAAAAAAAAPAPAPTSAAEEAIRGGREDAVETEPDGIRGQGATTTTTTTTPSLCSATSGTSTPTVSDNVVEPLESVVFFVQNGVDNTADATVLSPALAAAIEEGGKGTVNAGAHGSLETATEGGNAGLDVGQPTAHNQH